VLRVAENGEADLRHRDGPVVDVRSERRGLLDRGIDVVDLDVRVPVRRDVVVILLEEAGVAAAVLLQHRVVGVRRLRDLDLGSEELCVEACRGVDVARVQLVPDHRPGHVSALLVIDAPASQNRQYASRALRLHRFG
jgi:hypothetical protein